jgi:hypothetical protein
LPRESKIAGATYGSTEDVLHDFAHTSIKASFRRDRHQADEARQLERMGDALGDFRRNPFLIGLGLGGLLRRLDLLFHWLEGGSEHCGGQLGNLPAITDSGFNPFLDQPLLQFDELRRAFHCG